MARRAAPQRGPRAGINLLSSRAREIPFLNISSEMRGAEGRWGEAEEVYYVRGNVAVRAILERRARRHSVFSRLCGRRGILRVLISRREKNAKNADRQDARRPASARSASSCNHNNKIAGGSDARRERERLPSRRRGATRARRSLRALHKSRGTLRGMRGIRPARAYVYPAVKRGEFPTLRETERR